MSWFLPFYCVCSFCPPHDILGVPDTVSYFLYRPRINIWKAYLVKWREEYCIKIYINWYQYQINKYTDFRAEKKKYLQYHTIIILYAVSENLVYVGECRTNKFIEELRLSLLKTRVADPNHVQIQIMSTSKLCPELNYVQN